jgi:hypothetical protein
MRLMRLTLDDTRGVDVPTVILLNPSRIIVVTNAEKRGADGTVRYIQTSAETSVMVTETMDEIAAEFEGAMRTGPDDGGRR